jgi:hypothetical protein
MDTLEVYDTVIVHTINCGILSLPLFVMGKPGPKLAEN